MKGPATSSEDIRSRETSHGSGRTGPSVSLTKLRTTLASASILSLRVTQATFTERRPSTVLHPSESCRSHRHTRQLTHLVMPLRRVPHVYHRCQEPHRRLKTHQTQVNAYMGKIIPGELFPRPNRSLTFLPMSTSYQRIMGSHTRPTTQTSSIPTSPMIIHRASKPLSLCGVHGILL